MLAAAGAIHFLRCRETPADPVGNSADPAGRDNISILPLEWLSGKMKNPAECLAYARFQRHQPLFRSSRKLYPLRPDYPAEALALLRSGVWPQSAARHRRHCLRHGNLDAPCFWKMETLSLRLEPNAEMRRQASDCWPHFRKFTSIAGTAEKTTLPDRSVDFVTAAQAAHWFDRGSRPPRVRANSKARRLAGSSVERTRHDPTPFLREYEQLLLTYGTDYEEVRHERTTEAVNEFFDPAPYQERSFDMRQEFDYAGP